MCVPVHTCVYHCMSYVIAHLALITGLLLSFHVGTRLGLDGLRGIPGFIKIGEVAVVLARSGMAQWETDLFQASLPQVVGQSLEQVELGAIRP